MYVRPPTSSANTHITRHILPRHTTHGRGFPPIATAGSVPDRPAAEKQWGFGGFFPSRTTTTTTTTTTTSTTTSTTTTTTTTTTIASNYY